MGTLFLVYFTYYNIIISDKPSYENKRHYNDFFIYFTKCNTMPRRREHYKRHISNYPISSALDSKNISLPGYLIRIIL